MTERHNLDSEGLIFNIQRFSIHDGPGIRTTVFFKGCPLKCLWCSNPESQLPSPQLMVRNVRCSGCGQCVAVCPQGAIVLDDEGRKINWDRCDHCLQCVKACLCQSLLPCGSIMTSQSVVMECLKDRPFYKRSRGGITLSGGEPLRQDGFILDVLRGCKAHGLHTALDTSGYASWEVLKTILPFVDLLLFDVKHLDTAEHRRATGVDNGLILENLEKASGSGARIWLRIPLVAGFNDSEDHFSKICSLAKDREVEKISLLPYHEGGKSKCDQMGRAYEVPKDASPSPERLALFKDIADRYGLTISVGH